MSDREKHKRQLLDQIEALLQEAYALPRGMECWERREEIEWEILQLCRQYASLFTAPPPYWTEDHLAEGAD